MNIQDKQDYINNSLPRIRDYISKPKSGMSQGEINILKLVLLFSDTIKNSGTKRKEQAINMVYSIVEPTMVVVCKVKKPNKVLQSIEDENMAQELYELIWKLEDYREKRGFTSSDVINSIKEEINTIREPIGLFSIKTSGSNLKKECNKIIKKVEPYIKDKNEEKLTEILDEIYSSESNLVVVRSKPLKNANNLYS